MSQAVDIATVRLEWETRYQGPPAPHLLRGAISERFPDNPLFHQHEGERVIYRYPHIHYRWERGEGIVVGFGNGVEALLDLPWPGMTLRLGNREVTVLEAHCRMTAHVIQPTDGLRRYRLRAPWLPFNQENFARYQTLSEHERANERDRLCVAGLLMALKGLGVTFPERLFAAFHPSRSLPCRYKDQDMLGFLGILVANIDLPDGFAFGRAVSHGYGWMVRESTIVTKSEVSQ